MVLHPGLKTEYFKREDWTQEWIDNVRGMLRDEYDRHYKNLPIDDDHDSETPAPTAAQAAADEHEASDTQDAGLVARKKRGSEDNPVTGEPPKKKPREAAASTAIREVWRRFSVRCPRLLILTFVLYLSGRKPVRLSPCTQIPSSGPRP